MVTNKKKEIVKTNNYEHTKINWPKTTDSELMKAYAMMAIADQLSRIGDALEHTAKYK